jgi:hypothetical protein
MKKTILIVAFISLLCTNQAQNRWFVGGTAAISYTDYFYLAIEPQFGYEFTDRWALGAGIGFGLADVDIYGVAEPYVRFCAWHNDRIFIDLKATGALGFNDELIICQLGIRPSLRFRINDHWDIAADIGLFGAAYTAIDGWMPAVGINAASAGLWFAYRF